MTTPIVDFVKKYAEGDFLRLHMPGHKGNGFLGAERCDITEIDGADVLYSANGIIRQSEENAAKLFGARATVYSTEGSSLAIRAMMHLFKLYCIKTGKKPLVAAGRNAHKTFVTACALLGIDIDWLLPENTDSVISCIITEDFLEKHILKSKEKPGAIYLTSPDYLGNTVDIAALSKICKKHEILLIVDNAHGAYLNFLSPSRHPVSLGADICCDSAHKTLPVLTGGAYLHISHTAPNIFAERAQDAMSLFASTSPSYLILQSLDMVNRYLKSGYSAKLQEFEKQVAELKKKLVQMGLTLIGDEPLKVTIAPKAYGYTGNELAKLLSNKKIVCEFSDPDYTVMMLTPEIGAEGLERIRVTLSAVNEKMPITEAPPKPTLMKKRVAPSKAAFLPAKELDIYKCIGKVLATPSVTCPPAIPVVVCGEEIDQNAINCFEYYGIKKCLVIDETYL